MGALIRIVQSLPLVIALCVVAAVIYFVVAWLRTPTRAKEILIKVFLVLTGALSAVFLLATVYSAIEGNQNTLEFFVALLAISAIALAITLVCRWRFRVNHPHYKYTPQRSRTKFRWEDTVKQLLKMFMGGPFNPRG